jgi:N-acylneuraminate cytidylyltransferase
VWLEQRPIFSAGAIPLILPRYRVEDIDTPDDWTRAEGLFRALREAS